MRQTLAQELANKTTEDASFDGLKRGRLDVTEAFLAEAKKVVTMWGSQIQRTHTTFEEVCQGIDPLEEKTKEALAPLKERKRYLHERRQPSVQEKVLKLRQQNHEKERVNLLLTRDNEDKSVLTDAISALEQQTAWYVHASGELQPQITQVKKESLLL